MIQNREMTIDDYLAMLRRRLWVILLPTILAPAIGFAVSYAFTPRYTSTALVLIEEQKVPEGYVKPVVTEDLVQRITRLQQRALSAEELRPLMEKLKLSEGMTLTTSMEDIRQNVKIQSVQAVVPGSAAVSKGDVPGFNVSFTGNNPRQVQMICSEVTGIMIRENFADREEIAKQTTEFLGRQAQDAKQNLDGLDSRLATFKARYLGQLPEDSDKNLQILMGLNQQLEAASQTLNRAQQDKAYAESVLAQQLAAWKSTADDNADPRILQKQMGDLQSQLLQLKARYTDDYPEVIKTKADIRALQKKIDDVNAAAASNDSAKDTKASVAEPPEIQQLRLQIHQQKENIAQVTRAQQKLEEQIKVYQGRVSLSPAIDQQYKELTRGYDSAQKTYNDLLAKKAQAEIQFAMEKEQQGEQMHVQGPANLPELPSFPNRLLFAAGGLGGGLVLGLALAMWLEFRDKSVRTEADVIALLGLPVLTQVPWVGAEPANGNGSGKSRSGGAKQKETVEV
ncbi:MAG TPA: Wzz/FepE/Etk N-terminal domain-containing protein [Terriglobales bacterium]|jgi:polysaccharide chain length determinant protein (PEP-CTERM system associated)|nr:Wzz/FepE/Etk N-terminal domain-containing protein [Terriglobales bacterium]